MSKEFSIALIEEVLILDQENKLLGNVVLLDPQTNAEIYQASFDLEDEVFIIEKANEWDEELNESYLMAMDGEVIFTSVARREIAEFIFDLAIEHNLVPNYFILHGNEEED